MKMFKKFGSLCLAGLLAVTFVGCSDHDEIDDLIIDFAPIQINVMAESQDGKDLLNPTVEGNLLTQNIKAVYRGEEYTNGASSKSRVYLPNFFGLITVKLQNGKYALSFGELDGGKDFKNEEIIIDWGDGKQDVITFSNTVKWEGKNPDITRSFQLNGKTVATDTPTPVMKVVK